MARAAGYRRHWRPLYQTFPSVHWHPSSVYVVALRCETSPLYGHHLSILQRPAGDAAAVRFVLSKLRGFESGIPDGSRVTDALQFSEGSRVIHYNSKLKPQAQHNSQRGVEPRITIPRGESSHTLKFSEGSRVMHYNSQRGVESCIRDILGSTSGNHLLLWVKQEGGWFENLIVTVVIRIRYLK